MFENNQGQEFEQVIEWANMAYYTKREALIQKIPVPWKVERRFDYVSNTNTIVSAYPEHKSTVDFGGTAKGKSIWFDAKTTKNKTNFPLANLKGHQIDFLQRVEEQGGIGFWLIFSQSENATWVLYQSKLDEFLKDYTRKSIPYAWLNDNCPKVYPSKDNPLDYLAEVLKP
jgi:recombination protein U